MTASRRQVFFNQTAPDSSVEAFDPSLIRAFHRSLPGYEPTRLVPLPDLAQELNVKGVFIKDEGSRLGLPSFKILGASWGTFHALATYLKLPLTTSITELAIAAKAESLALFAATDGNHGRAVAFMARLLGLEAHIYVPRNLSEHTKRMIIDEGAVIIVSKGDYDMAVQDAAVAARTMLGGLLIQDTSFPGYDDTPTRIVEGYLTMMQEADEQLQELNLQCNFVFSPVGVGSLAQAVARHYKSKNRLKHAKVVTVEPDTAACLHKSLREGKAIAVKTSHTIMTGMDCGTVSHAAWSDLQALVDVSLTVSDFEAHRAVQSLKAQNVNAGPCGAAGLAALQYLTPQHGQDLGLDADSVVLLLNTEGLRPYSVPHDVSSDDVIELTQILTQIESTNPTLSNSLGSGETAIADYVQSWLAHRDIPSHRLESVSGRPSVAGVVPGTGSGRSLMINAHADTVSVSGYIANPLGGLLDTKHGRQVVTGRGCLDMKAGLAAGMTALSHARNKKLKGKVILAAVADEEDASHGTQELLARHWSADRAVIPEPTMLSLVNAHKGFVWLEVEILGFAAQGSRPDIGVDAILNTGLFLQALREYALTLPTDEDLRQASLHCGTISGGQEPSTYPASCKLSIEFRTIPCQEHEVILKDISKILDDIQATHAQFKYAAPRILLHRPPYKLPADNDFVQRAAAAAKEATGQEIKPVSLPFWCDAALLGQAGIPTVVFGPSGEGLHADEEWVDVESIRKTEAMLDSLIDDFCA